MLCPQLMVEGANYGAIVPWEIVEAIKAMVTEGNASKTAYSYNSDANFTEVDVLSQKCVADIKSEAAGVRHRRARAGGPRGLRHPRSGR